LFLGGIVIEQGGIEPPDLLLTAGALDLVQDPFAQEGEELGFFLGIYQEPDLVEEGVLADRARDGDLFRV
jgi:hypothetical protein